MEISGKLPPLEKTEIVTQAAKTAEKQASAPIARGDRVELSARARELQQAHEAISRMDDMDMEKVARIKAQVQAGTYKIDAEKIAGKMIDEALINDLG